MCRAPGLAWKLCLTRVPALSLLRRSILVLIHSCCWYSSVRWFPLELRPLSFCPRASCRCQVGVLQAFGLSLKPGESVYVALRLLPWKERVKTG